MSKWGKVLFFIAGLSLGLLLAVRYLLGGWVSWLTAPLVISVVAFSVAFIIDYKLYLEFFTMRTTKHGMNMGTMIVLVLAGLVSVNVLAVRKNKVWDVTEDKLFSLSQQSVDVVKPLTKPLQVLLFYRGEKVRDAMNSVRETLKLYQDASNQVDVVFYDAYVANEKAAQYLAGLPDKDAAQNKVFTFVEYEGKRQRVESPFTETEITSAIVKVTRTSNKKVYFLAGHGERELSSEGEEGAKALAEDLKQFGTTSETLNLLQNPQIPEDAQAIVIAGPKSPLLDNELAMLRTYAQGGGKLLIMADPGEKHNLAGFLREFGVDFANTFVVNGGLQVMGVSQVTVVGLQFDQASPITKPFVNGNTYALFHLVSEVKKASTAESTWTYADLVKTSDRSFSINELSDKAKQSEVRAYVLGMTVKGKLKNKEGQTGDKEFSLVVYGDSDFASNKLMGQPPNRDLALNSLAYLTGEGDLISIRPKAPSGTKLTMSRGQWLGVVGAGVGMPLALIILGSFVWFRRRSA